MTVLVLSVALVLTLFLLGNIALHAFINELLAGRNGVDAACQTAAKATLTLYHTIRLKQFGAIVEAVRERRRK